MSQLAWLALYCWWGLITYGALSKVAKGQPAGRFLCAVIWPLVYVATWSLAFAKWTLFLDSEDDDE